MVEIEYAIGNTQFGIKITGHAAGSPVTCAAVSSLAGAWSAWCERRGGTVREESGDYAAVMTGGRESSKVLQAVLLGLERVRLADPERVSMRKVSSKRIENWFMSTD